MEYYKRSAAKPIHTFFFSSKERIHFKFMEVLGIEKNRTEMGHLKQLPG